MVLSLAVRWYLFGGHGDIGEARVGCRVRGLWGPRSGQIDLGLRWVRAMRAIVSRTPCSSTAAWTGTAKNSGGGTSWTPITRLEVCDEASVAAYQHARADGGYPRARRRRGGRRLRPAQRPPRHHRFRARPGRAPASKRRLRGCLVAARTIASPSWSGVGTAHRPA